MKCLKIEMYDNRKKTIYYGLSQNLYSIYLIDNVSNRNYQWPTVRTPHESSVVKVRVLEKIPSENPEGI